VAQQFGTINSMPYIGAVQGAVTKLCTPQVSQPMVVPLVFDWNVYWQALNQPVTVAVAVDLGLISPAGGTLDTIRSVKIDNTFSTSTIYVKFDDTQDVVACPPQTIVTAPVNTNGQKFTVIGESLRAGFLPFTRIYLYNIQLMPAVDIAVQDVFPQWRGSPTVQTGSNLLLTPGFAPPALGDQTRQYVFSLLSPADVNNIFDTPYSKGFIYLTGMWLQVLSVFAALPSANQVITLESSGSAGVLFQWWYAYTPNAANYVPLFAQSGMQLRIDATQHWKLRHGGTPSGLCTCTPIFTYNPD